MSDWKVERIGGSLAGCQDGWMNGYVDEWLGECMYKRVVG